MGLYRGALGVRRYRVVDQPSWQSPKNKAELRKKLERGIVAHKFAPVDPKADADFSVGWVAIDDLDDTELNDARLFFGAGQSELHVMLRRDRLIAPPVEVRRQLEQKSRKLESERGRPLGRTERKNLKLQIERALRSRVFPQTRVYDLVWNFDDASVLYWGSTKQSNDVLLELFAKSFGMQLEIDGPARWVSELLDEKTRVSLKPVEELWKGFADVRTLSLADDFAAEES